MKSEREKMLAGELYFGGDADLTAERTRARHWMARLATSSPDDRPAREALIREGLSSVGSNPWIEPPFSIDYGSNITIGNDFYANFNCIILDVAPVRIGDHVLLAPNVQLYTATHPLEAHLRLQDLELGRPITIGDNVWIGGGAIICPGVTIGDHTVIGAGSVVTRSLPDRVVAAGNPARILRQLPTACEPDV